MRKSNFLLSIILLTSTAISAQASGVSYTFNQSGWSDGAGDSATLTGNFSGTPELNGELLLADLTTFQAMFQESGPLGSNTFDFNLSTLTDFSFDPTNGLDFAAGSGAAGIQLCSGGPDTNAICFGINPNSGSATVFSGFFEDLPTFQPATTRLGITVTPTGTVSAPEPGGVGLFAVAGMTLLGIGVVRRGRTTA